MGQTLTHGIYLPDEGERNCYSGLAANWQILDTSVGTIAEHTTALAGKAPLVHTHTKSNITDLLNSNFIPSANNSYDLGSSSYQWNNLYAKNYYYNGVAWGLDKENTWSQNQIISSAANRVIAIKNTTYTLGDATPSASKVVGSFAFKDSNNENAAYIDIGHYSSGEIYSRWLTRYKFDNGVKSTTGTTVNTAVDVGLTNSGDRFLRPYQSGTHNLGTSTNKWKTLNGVNPGGLSLPATTHSDIDTTDWTLTGSTINYTPVLDGWVEINLNANANSFTRISVENTYYRHSSESQAGNQAMLTFPVRANQTYGIKLWGSSILQARFIKCEGNV